MSGEQEPTEGGLTLEQAYREYVSKSTQASVDAANDVPGARNRVATHGSPAWRARRRARLTRDAAYDEFRDFFKQGELVAFMAQDSPMADRKRVPDYAWSYIRANFDENLLEDDKGHRFYAVSVYSRNQVNSARETPDNQPALTADKIPAKTIVADAFAQLTDDQKQRIDVHGGKREFAIKIQERNPDYPLETIERQLSRLLQDQRRSR